MKKISVNNQYVSRWISSDIMNKYQESISIAEATLSQKKEDYKKYLGWINLPSDIDPLLISQINEAANKIRETSDVLVCIGIGGSYLGAKAAIEFICPTFDEMRKPRILFAGHHINSDYYTDLLNHLQDKRVSINVISKSGTTIEPAIGFRIIKEWLEKKYGKEDAKKRIFVTTDPKDGILREIVQDYGYTNFSIPPDIGGRFSVLTPVGLLPMAVAGIDIQRVIAGAKKAISFCSGTDISKNYAAQYAAIRNILFRRGKVIEVLASFSPCLHYIGEWWKQLMGESEGKNNTGIFPASVDYTTDLHSLGQLLQEGTRNLFETFLVLSNTNHAVIIPSVEKDDDELNYLSGKSLESINEMAFKGTLLAHLEGGVPCNLITLTDRSEETLGQLFYFMEKTVAISGLLLRVNPFDQPGVNEYKNNMLALLNNPKYGEYNQTLTKKMDEYGL